MNRYFAALLLSTAGRVRVVLSLLISAPAIAHAQEGASVADSAAATMRQAAAAVDALGVENWVYARRLFIDAANMYARANDPAGEAEALERAAGLPGGDPGSSLQLQQRALETIRRTGDLRAEVNSLLSIASLQGELAQHDSARAYQRQALDLAERSGETGLVGYVMVDMAATIAGEYPDSALVYYDRGIALLQSPLDAGDRETAAYLAVAVADSVAAREERAGRIEAAGAARRRALAYASTLRNVQGAGSLLWADKSLEIGAFYHRMGLSDSALVHWKGVVADPFNGADAADSVATLYESLAEADSAIAYLKVVARSDRGTPVEAEPLNRIARLYQALQRNDSAGVYFLREGRARRRWIDFEETERAFRDAAELGVTETSDDPLVIEAEAALAEVHDQILSSGWTEADYSLRRARALADIGRAHSRASAPDLYRAVAYFDSAAAALLDVARRSESDARRVQLAEEHVDLYADWALAWLARAAEEGEQRSASMALGAVEQGRSLGLRHLRGYDGDFSQTVSIYGDPQPLAEDLPVSLPLEIPILTYLVTHDTLVVWASDGSSSELTVARVPVSRDSIAALVRTLRSSYDLAPGAGRSLGWLEETRGFGLAVRPSSPEDYRRTVETVHELLLPSPIRSILPDSGEVVIAPSGYLNELPFAVLARSSAETPLGHRLALRYVPSIQILNDSVANEREYGGDLISADTEDGWRLPRMPEKWYAEEIMLEQAPLERKSIMDDSARVVRRNWLARSLVVGNPTMPRVPRDSEADIVLPPLPAAEREARFVSEALGTRLLTGDGATEDAIRRRLNEATVIHLATHGYAYSAQSSTGKTFVALAPGGEHDGLLTVNDLLDDPEVSLRADLVVLSACQTALGAPTASEGTLGLQRALLARGASSVLVSLWSVSDQATQLLMERFYHYWLREEDAVDKAESLRRAQRDVAATPGFEHPRFWAAFQLVGAR